MDRRKFIIGSGRWLMAGGLTGISGLLLYRRRIGDPNDCFINPYCKRCSQNKSCSIASIVNLDDHEKGKGK